MKEVIFVNDTPKDIKDKLKEIAKSKGLNLRTVCIMAFEEFIKKYKV